jgi:hypothetical protein
MKMEIMWVETIDKLLKDENLRKSYSKKLSKGRSILELKRLLRNGRRS